MLNIKQIAKEIVAREGGYVNDPDDPGGATKYGVTIGTMRRLGIDLDGDDTVSVKDLKSLTRSDAERIFLEHYYHGPGIAKLPSLLRPSVFDMYVNAGSNAVRILQALMNEMEFIVVVDGKIGPETIHAARSAALAAPDHLADAYGIARRNYYYALADRRRKSRKYARRRDGGKGGWITRAEKFMAGKYHFSSAQHRERVSAWG